MANLIGEGFNDYVRKQINHRQRIHGSLNKRSLKELSYLNSNTSWIKMASSTSITGDRAEERLKLLELSGEIGKEVDLAKNFVLFNGTSRLEFDNASNLSGKFIQKGGIKENKPFTKVKTNKSYGVGGLEFGQQPMPGIMDLSIQAINKGSLRKATVKIKAYNKQQLAIIDVLYLRLGFTVLVEFGNSHYIDSKGNVQNVGSTLIEEKFFSDLMVEKSYLNLLPEIEKNRLKYCGNYDGFFARVVNFNWNFNPDGSYDITLYLISIGDVIESLKVNSIAGRSLLYEFNTASPEEQMFISKKFGDSTPEEVKKALEERLRESNKIFDYLLSIREYYDFYKRIGNLTKEQLDALVTPVRDPSKTEPTIVTKDGAFKNGEEVQINPITYGEPGVEFTKEEIKLIKELNPLANIEDDGSWSIVQNVEGQQGQQLYIQYQQTVANVLDLRNSQLSGDNFTAPIDNLSEEQQQIVFRERERRKNEIQKEDERQFNLTYSGDVNPFKMGSDESVIWDYAKYYYQFQPNELESAKSAVLGKLNPNNELLKNAPFNLIDPYGPGGDKISFGGTVLTDPNTGLPDQYKDANEAILDSNTKKYWPFFLAVQQSIGGRAVGKMSYNQPKNLQFSKTQLSTQQGFVLKPDLKSLSEDQKDYINNILPQRYYDGEEVKKMTKPPTEVEEPEPIISSDTDLPNVYFVKGNKEIPFGEVLNGPVFNRDKSIYKYKRTQNSSKGTIKEFFKDHYYANYSPSDYGYYIRFGNLLGFIQDEVLIKIDNAGKKKKSPPIFNLSTDIESNVMFTMPNHISLDPRVCITNVQLSGVKTEMQTFKGLEEFQNRDPFYGKIMNIYLSHMFIEEVMRNNTDNNGDISLFEFLDEICAGINRSLGGVNNLHVSVDETVNCIKIYDDTPVKNVENIKDYLKELDKKSGLNHYEFFETFKKGEFKWDCNTLSKSTIPYSLNLYGYNGGTNNDNSRSNFIKNVSLKTAVTKDMATMLSIGATANGYVVGEESTAFSKWNYGIEDRYYQQYLDGDGENFNSAKEQERIKEEGDQVEFQYVQFLFKYFEGNTQRYYSGVKEVIIEEPLDPDDPDSDSISKITYEPGGGQFYNEEIESNISVGTEFYRRLIASASLNQKLPAASTQGFLPISLDIDLDGIAGIKIYQKVEVDTSFLPNNYPDNMSFITKGLNHTLKDNTWTTQLSTLATSQISNTPIEIKYFSWDLESLAEETFKANNLGTDKNPYKGKGGTAMGSRYKTNPNPIIVKNEEKKKKFKELFRNELGSDFDNFVIRKGDDNPNSNITKFQAFLKRQPQKRITIKPDGSGTQMGAAGDISDRLLVALENWYEVLGKDQYLDLYNGALGTPYIRISGANDRFHQGMVYNIKKYPLKSNKDVGPWNTTHTRGIAIDISMVNPYSSEKAMKRNLLIQKSLWEAGFKGIIHHGKGSNSHIHTNIDRNNTSMPVKTTSPPVPGLDIFPGEDTPPTSTPSPSPNPVITNIGERASSNIYSPINKL